MTERKRLDRTDWTLILLAFTVTGFVVYLSLDPDPAHRRMAYYYTLFTATQKLAAQIGEYGLRAEVEYRRLLELERTV